MTNSHLVDATVSSWPQTTTTTTTTTTGAAPSGKEILTRRMNSSEPSVMQQVLESCDSSTHITCFYNKKSLDGLLPLLINR